MSTFTRPEPTQFAGRAVARRPWVQVHVTSTTVVLTDAGGDPLAELTGGERTVPDLGLLVSGQPPRRVLAGFERQPMLQLLASLEPDAPTDLRTDGPHARIGPANAPLTGWASSDQDVGTEVLVRPSLLAAAARACVGDEVLVGVASRGDPLTVTSPDQPQMTSLVMPMEA